ncbi:MAG: hypothetical protein ABI747_00940 [Candidatus Moraniibacteriota bacterium]
MATDNRPINPFLGGERPPVSRPIRPLSSRDMSAQSAPVSATRPFSPSPPVAPAAAPAAPNVSSEEIASSPFWRRYWWGGVVLLSVILVGAGVFFWFRNKSAVSPPVPSAPLKTETTKPSESQAILPETPKGNAEYESENFKAGEIVFGGELAFLQGEEDVAPLEISDIRGEAFTEKNKQEVKLVVTWKTNKLSLAEVGYAKGVGQAEKKVSEADYSFNHSLIITGLDPASTYLYTIKGQDRFGQEVTSEPHAVFTGARSVSLFDLIAGAIGDVFGWAVNK